MAAQIQQLANSSPIINGDKGWFIPQQQYGPTFRVMYTPYKTARPLYILTQDFEWSFVDSEGKLHRFVIKAGYITDKASVPQVFWSLGFIPEGLPETGALFHDYLYQHKGDPGGERFSYTIETVVPGYSIQTARGPLEKPALAEVLRVTKHFTRAEVDSLFKTIMLSCGVSKAKAETMYLAVRACGGFSGGFGW